MTFTLLARDPDSGDIGFAIASYWPAVGGVVPYYRREVGVVAAQSNANAAMAEAILDTLAAGAPPDRAMLAVLPHFAPEDRQVLILTHAGGAAIRTGPLVEGAISEAEGPDCVAAGNRLANDRIAPALIEGYLASRERPFADRLLLALRAGEHAGGDKRGREAAALRIWPRHYPDPLLLPLDIRCDEDPDPVAVLERALDRRRSVEMTRY
ncbi:MAG: DUF1028 domain-containing protein [Azospirillaceae bacterium]